jgi:hypothetical protein
MNYIDISYANKYMPIIPSVGSKWDGYSDEKKQKYIDYSTYMVDRVRWIGKKSDITQPNEFPRLYYDEIQDRVKWGLISDELKNQLEHDENRIPESIRQASIWTIVNNMRTGNYDTFLAMQESNVNSFSAGSVSFNFKDPSPTKALPVEAWKHIYYLSLAWWNTSNYVTRL